MVGWHREPSSMFCDDLEEWDGGEWEAHEGGDIGIHIADSLCYTGETNITLSSNYTPVIIIIIIIKEYNNVHCALILTFLLLQQVFIGEERQRKIV